jgi:hypothetical protein
LAIAGKGFVDVHGPRHKVTGDRHLY